MIENLGKHHRKIGECVHHAANKDTAPLGTYLDEAGVSD